MFQRCNIIYIRYMSYIYIYVIICCWCFSSIVYLWVFNLGGWHHVWPRWPTSKGKRPLDRKLSCRWFCHINWFGIFRNFSENFQGELCLMDLDGFNVLCLWVTAPWNTVRLIWMMDLMTFFVPDVTNIFCYLFWMKIGDIVKLFFEDKGLERRYLS